MDIIKDQVIDQYLALKGLWKNKRVLAFQVDPWPGPSSVYRTLARHDAPSRSSSRFSIWQ